MGGMSDKKSPGQPTKYNEERDHDVYMFCLLGATNPMLAKLLGVCETTIVNWRNPEHPSFQPKFLAAVTRGKEEADAKVAQALFKRAIGYEHPAIHFTSDKNGTVTETPYTRHYPPDTPAIKNWLANRQRDIWCVDGKLELSGTLEMKTPVVIRRAPDGPEHE